MLVSVAVSKLIFLIACVVFLIRYKDKDGLLASKEMLWFTHNTGTMDAMLILNCIFLGLVTVLLFLDFRLLCFHFWLMKNNMTTYEHILATRRKKNAKVGPQQDQDQEVVQKRKNIFNQLCDD